MKGGTFLIPHNNKKNNVKKTLTFVSVLFFYLAVTSMSIDFVAPNEFLAVSFVVPAFLHVTSVTKQSIQFTIIVGCAVIVAIEVLALEYEATDANVS